MWARLPTGAAVAGGLALLAYASSASAGSPARDAARGALGAGWRAVPPASQSSAASSPVISEMIVGRRGTLLAARPVRATAATVHVPGRRCRVAAGTPLGALAVARRRGGPPFGLHDYAHCSASAADGSGLFVYRIGREVNRGMNGWVYKVDHRVSGTGAGDETGPDGRRLRAGQRLLWFYCVMGHAGCQRTLEINPERPAAAPGATLAVTVTAYDDRGRGRPQPGATVTLAGSSAITGSDGRATLTAPATPARLPLTATAPGAVAAFPIVESIG